MPRRSGRGRSGSSNGPAIVYSALSFALVVLLASLAFTARQPPSPQMAELTPQARHQIQKAPNQMSSSIGSADGGQGGEGAATTSTTSSAAGSSVVAPGQPPLSVPAAHHCFGNPPMQIPFDTQSPPCVAYWSGANGGATYQGVTKTSVTVMVTPAALGGTYDQRITNDLEIFFDRTFELYGRTLRLIDQYPGGGDCATARAQADGVVQGERPFAVGDPVMPGSACFSAEVASEHTVAVQQQTQLAFSTATLRSYAPYLWQYPAGVDRQLADIGGFICGQLAGRPAKYSPDPLLSTKTRRFGLILEYDATPYPPQPAWLASSLRSCGADLADSATYEDPDEGSTADREGVAQFAETTIAKMSSDGVTTIVCYCVSASALQASFPAAADSQHYYPEWLLAGTNDNFDLEVRDLWPQADQRRALFGMTWEPPQVPYPDITLNEALAEVDPGFQVNASSQGALWQYERFYWEVLAIASGIQMAGPDLTPYTFERGLQEALFPNPYSPEMEGVVGFGGDSFAMTTDAGVMFWSNTALPPYADEGAGAWCYVDGGRRFGGADWSAPMQFFGTCDSYPPGV